MTERPALPEPAPPEDAEAIERQVEGFIARFAPAIAALVRVARDRLRHRLPGAVELVYDNYNALAIGYAATARTSDVAVSLAVHASGVLLYFYHGAALADPDRLLQGSGSRGRHLRLADADRIADPAVERLIAAALDHGRRPMPREGGRTIVKSISAKQRPRRPAAKEREPA